MQKRGNFILEKMSNLRFLALPLQHYGSDKCFITFYKPESRVLHYMMTSKFSAQMSQILGYSRDEALRLQNETVTPVHILLAMMRDARCTANELVCRFCDSPQQLKVQLENAARKHSAIMTPHPDDMSLDAKASKILKLCVLEARHLNSDTIETEHMLLAILRENDNEASSILQQNQMYYNDILNALAPQTETKEEVNFSFVDYDDEEDGTQSKQQTATKSANKTATPALDSFGTDLTKMAVAGKLDPVIGRDKEIERVAQILCRRKKNNPVLIGEPGVGKSAIVEGLALRIANQQISRSLWNKRVVSLDLGGVVAGTKYRGQFEERIRTIINELQKNPDIIIFIDEIHTLVGAGSAPGTMDAANMLKPALSRGEIQCVGATTLDEYRKSIEKDGALERRFQKVLVEPTTKDETLQILTNVKGHYENHHGVTYTNEALQACVNLTERYISDRCFPDKALDALDEAGAREHIKDVPVSEEILSQEALVTRLNEKKNQAANDQNFELAADYRDQLVQAKAELTRMQDEWQKQQDEQRSVVDAAQIAEVVALMTGIPVQRIDSEQNKRLRNLAGILSESVIGQDEAIRQVAKAIQRSRVGLKDPKKPIGAFLFVGPTGVGKTFLAKKLAEEMFGSDDALIRIDMSEYMEKHTVSRMVGAPPGYVGYDEGGQLTERVRRKPYSIVLLDEIEKAHQDVFNILLQVMDEGRLTDGNGTTVDFRNTIIIMTSNCGTRQLKDFGHGVGFGTTDGTPDKQFERSVIKKAITKQFAPEFINRLDDIIYFDQLDKEAIRRIVDIELRPLKHRIFDMGYTLQLTEAAKDLLGSKGYDVQFGARPLKRAIQSLLEDPICELIMSDNVPELGSLLNAEASGETITITTGK